MLNASNILGALLQGGGPRGHAPGRLEHAMGDRGLGGAGGPLGQILGRSGGTSSGSGQTGGSGDILGSLAGMLGGGGSAGGGGRPMGRDLMMGGLGALAGSILSGRGRSGGGGFGGGKMRGAVGAGGLAVLGMLAMNALRNRAQPAAEPAAGAPAGGMGAAFAGGGDPDTAAMPPEQTLSEGTARLVLRAMIDAAKADGRVDATERQRIMAKAQEGEADEEAVAYLQQAFERPADPDGLAAEARDPVVAAQVYAASLLAIQVDTVEEQDYLRSLAAKLGLERAVVSQLHGALGAPPPT